MTLSRKEYQRAAADPRRSAAAKKAAATRLDRERRMEEWVARYRKVNGRAPAPEEIRSYRQMLAQGLFTGTAFETP